MKKKVILTFPPAKVEEPVTYHLVADYGLVVNILRATVNPGKKGTMVVELKGSEDQLSRGLSYLERTGINVEPLTTEVHHLSDRCTSCTACVPVCPTGALDVDRETWAVAFDHDKCVVCGSCVEICPYKAVEIHLE